MRLSYRTCAAALLAVLAVAATAHAQPNRAPVPAQPVSPMPAAGPSAPQRGAYCTAGSSMLLQGFSPDTVDVLRSACEPGDTITIPARSNYGPGAVAMLCDMSKAVVVLENAIVCQFVPPRSVRN